MKKLLLFFALAGIVLAGCSKDETAPANVAGSKIFFEAPIVTPSTKAGAYDIIENTEYPMDWSFKVSAKQYAEGTAFATAGWNAGTEYINKETVSYDAAQKGWASSYYWPKQSTLTFQAFSPASEDGEIGTTGVTFADYNVDMAGEQVDLMYSTRTADQTKNDQIEQEYGFGTTQYYGVQIPFKHALSRICFTAKQKAQYTGTTITINEIKLEKLYQDGSFNQGLADDAVTGTAEAWTIADEAEAADSYNVVPATGLELNNDATPTATAYTAFNNLLVMPQDFTDNDDAKIYVKYTVVNGEGDDASTSVHEYEIALNELQYFPDDNAHDGVADEDAAELDKKFEIGKQYTFNLIIGLDKIYFAPKVETWKYVVINAEL